MREELFGTLLAKIRLFLSLISLEWAIIMKPHICKFLVMYGTMLNELISKHVLMLRAVEFWTQFGLELQIFCSVIQKETYVLKRFQSLTERETSHWERTR